MLNRVENYFKTIERLRHKKVLHLHQKGRV